jgi:hypothetical protein
VDRTVAQVDKPLLRRDEPPEPRLGRRAELRTPPPPPPPRRFFAYAPRPARGFKLCAAPRRRGAGAGDARLEVLAAELHAAMAPVLRSKPAIGPLLHLAAQ